MLKYVQSNSKDTVIWSSLSILNSLTHCCNASIADLRKVNAG